MARQASLVLLCSLFLTCLVENHCADPANYTTYYMEQERICHPTRRKETIFINDSAVIVKSHHMFNSWLVLEDKICRFVLRTNKGDGLFAVINKMSFRRDGDRCLDYVKFRRSNGQHTGEFCGQVKNLYYTALEPDNNSQNNVSNFENIFNVLTGKQASRAKLETEIFISKRRLQEGESLGLSIVYTPYKKSCNKEPFNGKEYKLLGSNACILKQYVCDGIQNCAASICNDEHMCENETPIFSTGTGTKVTIGAVTTIFLCFIIFVLCLWICRKNKKLCWSSDCAGPNVCSPREGALSDLENTITAPIPTAPILEVAFTPVRTVLPKDLPPSYDSLFPDRPPERSDSERGNTNQSNTAQNNTQQRNSEQSNPEQNNPATS